jgi:hypothetical protein
MSPSMFMKVEKHSPVSELQGAILTGKGNTVQVQQHKKRLICLPIQGQQIIPLFGNTRGKLQFHCLLELF